MKDKMTKKEMVIISMLTFSIFFGAGNLMFPPMLGKNAGTNLIPTMLYFAITAVILPVVGIVVVTKTNGLKNLAGRVDKVFGLVFTIATYLAIGPALAAPRAGVLPFEIAVKPFLSEGNAKIGLLIYTIIFFSIVYWFSLTPSKLLDRIGKVLSPAFLCLVILLFIGTIVKPLGSYAQPAADYVPLMGIQGFLDGYMTLDILAALNYGLVVAYIIKEKGVNDEKEMSNVILKTGIGAGILLFVIYFILSHIGAMTAIKLPDAKNGIEILSFVSKYTYGKVGFVILSGMFTIACLNIGIALVTSISQYFTQLVDKISYKKWVTFWTVLTFVIANMGLEKIMSYSVPVLLIIYPPAIVLVFISLIDKQIKSSRLVYSMTIYPTLFVSIISTLKIPGLLNIVQKLPLHTYDLGWVCVALVFFIISVALTKITNK